MKILQFCNKPPLPAVDGGCIAINNITRGVLKSGHDIKVVAISTPKHPFKKSELPQDYLMKTRFESVFIDTSLKKLSLLKALMLNKSYHVQRFISKELTQKIISILKAEEFDVIHLETIFIAPYIPVIRQYSKAKIVLRTHNIEHRIWERIMLHEKNIAKKIILRRITNQLKKFEYSTFNLIDGYMAISDQDYNFFHELFPDVPGTVIEAGIDMELYHSEDENIPSDKPELFHIGSMNWAPNIEGLSWFIEKVWGKINALFPQLTFAIAGRNTPAKFLEYKIPNLIILGEVKDAKEFILSKDIMIVPLLSGSGVRIKILEGMALGKTIITTTIGAEGLSVENGKNILIANDPDEFIEVIDKCVRTPDICKIIGENAKNYVTLYHNNEIITEKIIAFYYDLINHEPILEQD
jgi:glycosyltransferase involved in cell wall biosynthesis